MSDARVVLLALVACSAPDASVSTMDSGALPARPTPVVSVAPSVSAADAATLPSTPLASFTEGSQRVAYPDPIAGGRAWVSSARARVYPYSAVGIIVPIYCTLTMVGPHTALTAAHCVWDRNAGAIGEDGYRAGARIPITTILFGLSGASCDASAAYCMADPSPRLVIPNAFTDPRESNPTNYDFAFLDFAPRDVPGAVVGWFGTHVDRDGPLYLAGYPANEIGVSLWERGPGTTGDAYGGSLPDVFVHDLDVSPGDSGACVSEWIPTGDGLGWRVCVGVQIARIVPAGPNLARAWDATMSASANLGD